MDHQHLRQRLLDLEGKGYPAYQGIRGCYGFPGFALEVLRVQGDPFATPTALRVTLTPEQTGFPGEVVANSRRCLALEDYLLRQLQAQGQALPRRSGSGKSGVWQVLKPSAAILKRSAIHWHHDRGLEVRLGLGLPAQGRRILGTVAAQLLTEDLPQWITTSLPYGALDPERLCHQWQTLEDTEWLREQLPQRGLVAFIPDGARLARCSGVDDRPLATGLPLQSPLSLRVSFTCPHRGTITGLGIPQGITLIVGGGYHGKSTLLRAVERCIYPHIPGDGRDYGVTDPTAVKIRAEDGRAVTGVNLSPFIQQLPLGQDTHGFCTTNASGSTSQAAAIVEALEVGSKVLLLDEDTCATNFMIRDGRMQALIPSHQEPIIPFIDRVRQLWQNQGVSTILVMGGCGDYFEVADQVMGLWEFQPQDLTAAARTIVHNHPTQRQPCPQPWPSLATRSVVPRRFTNDRDNRLPKLQAQDCQHLRLGDEDINLQSLEQLIEVGQVRTIGALLRHWQHQPPQPPLPLLDLLAIWNDRLHPQDGEPPWDHLSPFPPSDWVMVRPLEVAAALNRWRSLRPYP